MRDLADMALDLVRRGTEEVSFYVEIPMTDVEIAELRRSLAGEHPAHWQWQRRSDGDYAVELLGTKPGKGDQRIARLLVGADGRRVPPFLRRVVRMEKP